MALYLGNSEKLKITSVNGACQLIIFSCPLILHGVMLKSLDNYILKDSSEVYLTAKEDE